MTTTDEAVENLASGTPAHVTPKTHVRLGEHDYPIEFLILLRAAPEETVLALDAADRLGYLAYCDEWTDGATELPEVFQHAADQLLLDDRLSARFNEFRKEVAS